ncbi:MAG: hypothetical protein R3256_12165, partial [Thalassovita sp.]|nr:hypothetical protein [Thalassovita sp.]
MNSPRRILGFEGLDTPLSVQGPEIEDLVSRIAHRWPYRLLGDRGDVEPFAQLSVLTPEKWKTITPQGAQPCQELDPVNTVCDLIVELSWEQIRSRSDLLCLHAAGIEFAGRLVVFPNQHRAGKSTLSAALARLGHAIYSDDFLPIARAPETRALQGLANGIAPRLRLPLPQGASAAFRAFVETDSGPSNRQYKYITDCPLPAHGEQLPIGAIVLLDRRDTPEPARLEPLSEAEAISALILQNFARHMHGAEILRALAAMAHDLPLYRLVFSDVEDAANMMHECSELQHLPTAKLATPICARPANLDPKPIPIPPDIATGVFVRPDGCETTFAGDEMFVATPDGSAIHRLNAGLKLIWLLLEHPATAGDVAQVLSELYPEIASQQ